MRFRTANRGTATASGYNLQQNAGPAATTGHVATENGVRTCGSSASGNQRWLVVRQTPEVLWPQIKDFWQDSGFLINLESPQAGVMETDWAENRAKIPQDFIRNTLGQGARFPVFHRRARQIPHPSRTRSRMARLKSISAIAARRKYWPASEKERTVWTPRPADPELEAEFLSRLMARLGVEETRPKRRSWQCRVAAGARKVGQGCRRRLCSGR